MKGFPNTVLTGLTGGGKEGGQEGWGEKIMYFIIIKYEVKLSLCFSVGAQNWTSFSYSSSPSSRNFCFVGTPLVLSHPRIL